VVCFSAPYKIHGKKGATFDIFSVETYLVIAGRANLLNELEEL
jgi:hypothetical protein